MTEDRAAPLARLVVLISGSGTNLQAILDACQSGELPARVVAVVSNRASAYGLERARLAGVPAVAYKNPHPQEGHTPSSVLWEDGLPPLDKGGEMAGSSPSPLSPESLLKNRTSYDLALAERVAGFQPDWVVLAGWLRVLTDAFLQRFPGRVVNLHPALPGTFPGLHAIERAFAAARAGEIDHTGVMVHLVPDEGVDSGPVLAQQIVSILPEESLEALEARIHTVEHRLLVGTLKKLILEK